MQVVVPPATTSAQEKESSMHSKQERSLDKLSIRCSHMLVVCSILL